MKSDSIVIIPTYNEKENIEKIIRRVFSYEKQFDILVVDDNSPDGTASIVKTLQHEYIENLHLLERPGKQGLGVAYIAGFEWSLEHNYDFVFEMDADFSHNPDDLIRLYDTCKLHGADMSVGSRYVSGVNVVNWPMKRVLLSYFASKYVRFITRMPLRDATAGFVCYSSKVLKSLNLDEIKFKGYAFQIEMKFRIWKSGFKVIEVPIIFTDRKEGTSKMNGGIIKEAVWGVISLKLESMSKKNKA